MAATVIRSRSQRKKLRTGPIKEIEKYIDRFTTTFCTQYEISHWQDEVAAECYAKWGLATQNQNVSKNGKTIAEQMSIPAYAKRVIYNAAIQWEQRWRKENHHSQTDGVEQVTQSSGSNGARHQPHHQPKFEFADLDLSQLSDIECLILELHYGFGRGEGDEVSITQIARRLSRSETWVRQRHTWALKVLQQSFSK